MNKERCRYCRKREAVLDGLCRFCWETLTELWGAAPLKAQAMPAQTATKNLMVKHDNEPDYLGPAVHLGKGPGSMSVALQR